MSLPGSYHTEGSHLDMFNDGAGFFPNHNLSHNNNNKSMFIPPPIPPPLMAPFDREISPPRKRTRTTPQQLDVLEKSFIVNPSPNHRTREQLSLQLGMPERSIQIWFQNRRAKVKNQAKRSAQMKDSLALQQKYAASAATAACQTVMIQQGQTSIDPNLYYYYYYYYFHQQQQQQYPLRVNTAPPAPSSSSSSPYALGHRPPSSASSTCSAINQQLPPDLTLSASTSTSSIKSDTRRVHSERTRAHSVGPYPTYYQRNSTPPTLTQERHASLGPSPFGLDTNNNALYNSVIMEEPFVYNNTQGK
jgi:hypothetical protein